MQQCLSKRGGVWSASLTPGGRYYLDNGAFPQAASEPPWPALPPRSEKSQERAEELLASLQGAGGMLTLPDPSLADRGDYRRAIHELLNGNLVPEGLRLR